VTQMTVEHKVFPLRAPFVITGYTFTEHHAIWVTVSDGIHRGRGEACGIYYHGDTPESMTTELEAIRSVVEAGASREDIQQLLPPGGARNALDCALWDLECKSKGATIWELTGIDPHPLTTVATIGIGEADDMAARARELAEFAKLKVKLDSHDPLGRLRAIRSARPDAEIVIDVNQGWDFDTLQSLTNDLAELGVTMVEQPLPRGADEQLEGYPSSIPIGGDESCLSLEEYAGIAGRYDVINIKLDKCGGLTEALQIAKAAKADGKKLMVGNMTGSSLAMAPSFVVGQLCEFVDIDGPTLLASDIDDALVYEPGGIVSGMARSLWG
jgi:L-alanine-DL-glutamate epimerase-like enolase superfamily enzyme